MITISKKQTSILAVITALAVIMVVAPALLSLDDHMANAKKHHKGKSNNIHQSISQKQKSHQDSQVVSGKDSVSSGNNINLQNQKNEGNNAAAQK